MHTATTWLALLFCSVRHEIKIYSKFEEKINLPIIRRYKFETQMSAALQRIASEKESNENIWAEHSRNALREVYTYVALRSKNPVDRAAYATIRERDRPFLVPSSCISHHYCFRDSLRLVECWISANSYKDITTHCRHFSATFYLLFIRNFCARLCFIRIRFASLVNLVI